MVGVFVGLVVIAMGIIVPGYFARRSHRRAQAIAEVPRYECGQVVAHGRQAPGMRVSVHGQVSALPAGLLRAPISGTECAWYRLTISERMRQTTRESRRSAPGTVREKVVSEERSSEALMIDDGTGGVRIDPEAAQVESVIETFNQLEDPPAQEESTVSFGGLSITVGSTERVIGIRKKEEIIPIGAEAYVLGGAFARDGEGVIAAPVAGEYIISLQSGDALLRAARTRMLLWTGAGIVVGVIGIMLIFIGLAPS